LRQGQKFNSIQIEARRALSRNYDATFSKMYREGRAKSFREHRQTNAEHKTIEISKIQKTFI